MMGRVKKGEGALVGNAGEHYVMAELLKRGVIAGLTPRNAPGFDILAAKGTRAVRIRVKTKSEQYGVWMWVTKKDGSIFRDLQPEGDFTVLVDLTDDIKNMKFYIVATSKVDKWLKDSFTKWVKTPGKNGRPHSKTNTQRNLVQDGFKKELKKYLNNWDALWK